MCGGPEEKQKEFRVFIGEAQRRSVRFVEIMEKDAKTALSVNYRIDEQGIHISNFINIAAQLSKRTLNRRQTMPDRPMPACSCPTALRPW